MNSSRQLEGSGTSAHRPSHATIACPTCGIYQPVEIDYDGSQGCAIIPVSPCSVCHCDLCCFCNQAKCGCGQIVCLQCTVIVPDGTPSGLTLCKPCANSADPLCPTCGEFACMMPRENSEQQWFECSTCGAAMEGDEIDAVQSVPPPCAASPEPHASRSPAERSRRRPERKVAMRRATPVAPLQQPAPVQTKFLRISHAPCAKGRHSKLTVRSEGG